jgi:hypothetical protein
LSVPDSKIGQRILTKEEIKRIVDLYSKSQAGQTMNVQPSNGPFSE